jgi:hypothetical protein
LENNIVIQKTLEQAGRQAKPAHLLWLFGVASCRPDLPDELEGNRGARTADWDTRDAMLSLPGVRLDGWPVAHARLVVLRVDAISAPLRRIIMPFNWRVATRRRRHGRLVVRFAIVSLAVVVSSWFRKNANRKTRV